MNKKIPNYNESVENNCKIQLNEEQTLVYEKIVNHKKNVFITGSGGVGKSFLLKYIFNELNMEKNVALTSMTGISAQILGGVTLHSYLGIGLGMASYEILFKKIALAKKIYNRWKRLDILILDEISMLSIELFEKLERLARELRRSQLPFGGIQLIFCGDFLQLPTIQGDKFCFETPLWNTCIDEIFEMKTIVRQSDSCFISVLNRIRFGEIDEECKQLLKSREIKYISDTGLIPTMLYSTNDKVDSTNEKYYKALTGKEYTYKIKYKWFVPCDKEKHENNTRFNHELSLKVGAQVMFLVNDNAISLVNGSRGVVKGFIEGFPDVLFSNGVRAVITEYTLNVEVGDTTIMSYTQIPLRLSWAISIHKSQGCTLDLMRVDMKNIFEYGQFYVALSRARQLDSLYIRNLNINRCYTHPKALEFYANLEKK